jgi:diacylglycerol kinase family enzyme
MLTEDGIRGRRARICRDISEFTLASETPIHLQVDGDYVGMRNGGTFRAVPSALRVIA